MELNTVLLVDSESGGLDPAEHPLIEIGAIRWSIEHACVLSAWSTLIQAKSNDAEKVNRIPTAALAHGVERNAAFQGLHRLADKSDVIVAHQADFDRSFLPELGKPWVCSKFDMQWPNVEVDGESLVKICVANDVPVTSAHRALTDCFLLARLFERLAERGHDIRAMLVRGLRPKATFVSLAPFEEKDTVKAAGFKWFVERKSWERRMAVEDAASLPFKVKQIQAGETA